MPQAMNTSAGASRARTQSSPMTNDQCRPDEAELVLSFVIGSLVMGTWSSILAVSLLRLVTEVGLDEVVEVAVEDGLHLWRFHRHTLVLDHRVRLHDVVADLVA